MKVCGQCGRVGERGWIDRTNRTPVCRHRDACQRRAQFVGLWVGKRYLQRRDLDGTLWTIRPSTMVVDGLANGFILTCIYRDHRTTSWHATVTAAQLHRDDIVRSWQARSMTEYAQR